MEIFTTDCSHEGGRAIYVPVSEGFVRGLADDGSGLKRSRVKQEDRPDWLDADSLPLCRVFFGVDCGTAANCDSLRGTPVASVS